MSSSKVAVRVDDMSEYLEVARDSAVKWDRPQRPPQSWYSRNGQLYRVSEIANLVKWAVTRGEEVISTPAYTEINGDVYTWHGPCIRTDVTDMVIRITRARVSIHSLPYLCEALGRVEIVDHLSVKIDGVKYYAVDASDKTMLLCEWLTLA